MVNVASGPSTSGASCIGTRDSGNLYDRRSFKRWKLSGLRLMSINSAPGARENPIRTATPGVPNRADPQSDRFHLRCLQRDDQPEFTHIRISGYVGRWLRKDPGTGAGYFCSWAPRAYDSVDDLIAVYGGLQLTPGGQFVTDSGHRTTSGTVYEFTPPNASVPTGTWTARVACAGQTAVPTPRYGHSMVYDTRHRQLVVIGG